MSEMFRKELNIWKHLGEPSKKIKLQTFRHHPKKGREGSLETKIRIKSLFWTSCLGVGGVEKVSKLQRG